ncbi:hypothetical protein GCM10009555_007400 [Acrocarpospora macrocephala]|uniref:Uncharacterized protein n=1 Tax=Acrocarpospora macrocephala TaxID=150177 RepID=A0A5M3WX14_9ACTN|nr:hypothetical protein [Acrocarpospora macrocephala]GES12946.1 hypothetical protein Amac_065430 [Acrocarpospora macrocephala]
MTTHAPAYAGPADVAAFGPYGPGRLDRPSDRPVYPNLWPYARDLYQIPAFRETTDFAAIRLTRPAYAEGGLVRIAVEPHEADWDEPHGIAVPTYA